MTPPGHDKDYDTRAALALAEQELDAARARIIVLESMVDDTIEGLESIRALIIAKKERDRLTPWKIAKGAALMYLYGVICVTVYEMFR